MLSEFKQRNARRERRVQHGQNRLRGTTERPRLAVFRSNRHLFVQIIDDEQGKTLLGLGTRSKDVREEAPGKSKSAAKILGERIAKLAKQQQIRTVVFDRRWYKYHGIIAELANAARAAGLEF